MKKSILSEEFCKRVAELGQATRHTADLTMSGLNRQEAKEMAVETSAATITSAMKVAEREVLQEAEKEELNALGKAGNQISGFFMGLAAGFRAVKTVRSENKEAKTVKEVPADQVSEEQKAQFESNIPSPAMA